MRLVIEDIDPLEIEEFANYMLAEVKQHLLCELDPAQLHRFQDFLENHCSAFKKAIAKNKVIYDIKNIAIEAISNLEVHISHGACIIRINPNTSIPGSFLKYASIAKLINYGNASTAAYPIFSKVFKDIEQHLSDYYTRWLFEE